MTKTLSYSQINMVCIRKQNLGELQKFVETSTVQKIVNTYILKTFVTLEVNILYTIQPHLGFMKLILKLKVIFKD